MATVATLETRMALNSTAFRQGMVQAANQANASLGSISKQAGATASVLLSLKRAANTFGSFYLVKEGLGSLLEAQKQLQAIHFTLMAATGSSTLAADAFQFVSAESQKLGLVLPTAAQGFANLSASATAAGVSLSDQKELFDAYARSSTTLHLSTEQSSRALLALEQMFAKGKIQAQELRLQLGQAIPGAAQRFQNAVMEMTKGTSLAGKSFDQLLAAGELTTSKFLPALVKALQESGRGVEQAAQGLQANLNRVQTAWFNLKTDVSGGLFNDAATAGAGLLADNLGRIASAVSLIGAGGLARVLGGQIDSGAGRVTSMIAARQETLAHAMNTRIDTEAVLANTQALQVQAAADKDTAARKLKSLQATQASTLASREAAEAQFAEAAAAKLKADLTLSYKGDDPLVLTLRGQKAAAEASAAAARQLAVAQATYNSTRAAGTALQAEAAVSSSALAKADIELAAAEEALALAQANVARTRAAEEAVKAASAFEKAAASVGNFALSLVGGWTGAAVLAIGGIGYAIYSVQKQGEEWRAETAKEVKSLQDVAQAAKDAAVGFNTYWDARNHSAGVDAFVTGATAISKTKGEIAGLQDQIKDLQAAMGHRGGGGMLAGLHLDQLQTRVAELQASLPPATEAVGALGSKVSYGLLPAVDALKGGLDRLRAGASLKGIWDGLTEGFSAGDKALDDAKAKVGALQQEMQSLADKNEKDLKTRNKTSLQLQQQNLRDIEANIKAQSNLTKAEQAKQIADARSAAKPMLKLAADDDAAKSAKKTASAVNAEAEAYKSLVSQINSRMEQDKEAAADTSKLTEAQRLQIKVQEEFKVGKTKLTTADQAQVKQLLAQAVTQSLVTRATLQQRDADKALLDLDRQLGEQAEQRARTNARLLEGVGHGDQWNAERAGIESIQDAYRQQRVEADKAYEASKLQHGDSIILSNQHAAALGKITAAEQEAIVAQQQFFDAQKRANADWGLGFSKAIEDFQTQQQNNAAAGKKMVEDLTGGFTNAFTAFVSGTESAKSAFGSWIDDMYKQALAFVANKAIQALFDSFSATGGGSKSSTPGSSAGGWGSVIGNFFNALGSSGGKASGGDVHPWGAYPVAENGPEILKVGHRNILMMGDQSGTVVPNNQIGRAAGNTTVTNIYVQPTSTRRTADQIATANARTQRIASARNG